MVVVCDAVYCWCTSYGSAAARPTAGSSSQPKPQPRVRLQDQVDERTRRAQRVRRAIGAGAVKSPAQMQKLAQRVAAHERRLRQLGVRPPQLGTKRGGPGGGGGDSSATGLVVHGAGVAAAKPRGGTAPTASPAVTAVSLEPPESPTSQRASLDAEVAAMQRELDRLEELDRKARREQLAAAKRRRQAAAAGRRGQSQPQGESQRTSSHGSDHAAPRVDLSGLLPLDDVSQLPTPKPHDRPGAAAASPGEGDAVVTDAAAADTKDKEPVAAAPHVPAAGADAVGGVGNGGALLPASDPPPEAAGGSRGDSVGAASAGVDVAVDVSASASSVGVSMVSTVTHVTRSIDDSDAGSSGLAGLSGLSALSGLDGSMLDHLGGRRAAAPERDASDGRGDQHEQAQASRAQPSATTVAPVARAEPTAGVDTTASTIRSVDAPEVLQLLPTHAKAGSTAQRGDSGGGNTPPTATVAGHADETSPGGKNAGGGGGAAADADGDGAGDGGGRGEGDSSALEVIGSDGAGPVGRSVSNDDGVVGDDDDDHDDGDDDGSPSVDELLQRLRVPMDPFGSTSYRGRPKLTFEGYAACILGTHGARCVKWCLT